MCNSILYVDSLRETYLSNINVTTNLNVIFQCFIATNQRVVAAQRQQRGLFAVTIRGSVLFYSSAI